MNDTNDTPQDDCLEKLFKFELIKILRELYKDEPTNHVKYITLRSKRELVDMIRKKVLEDNPKVPHTALPVGLGK